MAQPDDLEARVSALETQVTELSDQVRRTQQDAAAARVLAGAADRDVDEFRVEIRDFREQNNRMLNAMREDITDLRAEMRSRFERVDARFLRLEGKLDGTAAGIQQIIGLLDTQEGEQDDQ